MNTFELSFLLLFLVIIILGLIFFFSLLEAKKNKTTELSNYDKILEYRYEHPRCRYCVYAYLLNVPKYLNVSIHKCALKDKTINFCYYRCRGCFCEYFMPKEPDINDI